MKNSFLFTFLLAGSLMFSLHTYGQITYATEGLKMHTTAYDPDTRYYDDDQYISFGTLNGSADFIGYKYNHFYFMDAPGGRDTHQPNVTIGGNLHVNQGILLDGSDFKLGLNDGRSVGNDTLQRAMVHHNNDLLVINYKGDFEGGIRIDGEQTRVTGSLTVMDDISTSEIEVSVNPGSGPDYVFEPDYDLQSLEEIERFIKSEKHLPEVPSAKEMEANGIALGDMNMLLLKKIEELTLHTIHQQKLINELYERLEHE